MEDRCVPESTGNSNHKKSKAMIVPKMNQIVGYYGLPGMKTKYKFPVSKSSSKYEYIEQLVLDFFKKTREEVVSKSRKRETTDCRHIIMFLCRRYTTYSLKDIGRKYDRDHTSVMHAERTVRRIMEENESYRNTVQKLEMQVQ